jgi:hypothetical protein
MDGLSIEEVVNEAIVDAQITFYTNKDPAYQIMLEDLGDTWQLEGILIGNGAHTLGMLLPDGRDDTDVTRWSPTTEEWEKWLKQSDDPIMKIYGEGEHAHIVKAIVRKATRQVDEAIKWKVYKRDSYTCVYCGTSGIPMTVDHYHPQALGGITTLDNLRASCRKCNKLKANLTIAQWKILAKKKGLQDGEAIIS